MSFTSPIGRTPAPNVADERAALNAYLDFQRATILHKMEGLEDADLRRAVAPAGLTLLGLVKHLTLVEQWWFAINYAQTGEEQFFANDDDPDRDLHVQDDETTDALVQGFLDACDRSRGIVASASSLDDVVPNERRGEVDLRWIMLHVIEEYARHNGHADIIRELIDGVTGV